jgi:hypothetical protein
MQGDDETLGARAGLLDGEASEDLIEGRLGGAIAVPAAQAIIADAAAKASPSPAAESAR